ncbi:MAG: hypothetical protein ACI8X5_001777, partial [Planctomycetota bacterium]
PDPGERQAGLRLDTFEFATRVQDGIAAIVPGDAQASELLRRVSAEDPDDHMPPPESHRKSITPAEFDLMRRWIEAGANYEKHWAFVEPKRPAVSMEDGHPIDHFIALGLEREGLEASPEVEPELALRRIFLDLTGLPPKPEETAEFLVEQQAGQAADVWKRWIEKLLTEEPYRSRYAERMASPWLDQARYADTNGIHMDAGRQIWPWRDWVLRAYRDNMPFDQFVTEQLAGDLIPEATVDQKVASGFNRNHVITDEGGAIDAEYLVEYAADRVATTSSVFLGLTMGCARCHDHKFDPITQAEYYEMFSFFYSNDEPGLYSQQPDPKRAFEPSIEVPSAEQLDLRTELAADFEGERAQLNSPSAEDSMALDRFRENLAESLGLEWVQATPFEASSANGATVTITDQGSILIGGENPDRDVHTIHLRTEATDLRLVQLDVLGHESFVNGAPGRSPSGNAVLSSMRVEAVSLRNPAIRRELDFSWLWADGAQSNADWDFHRILDGTPNEGWAIAGHLDKIERSALLLSKEPFGYEGGTEVIVTLNCDSSYTQHVLGHERIGLGKLGATGLKVLPLIEGRWYHVGPFVATDGADAYSTDFGPELIASFDPVDEFEIADGTKKRWQYKSEFKDGELNTLSPGVNVHYVAKVLFASEAQDLEVSLGSDDGFAIFVNGKLAGSNNTARGVAADQDRVTLQLDEGRNTVVFKIVNTGGAAGFYFKALLDRERYSLDMVTALVDSSFRMDQGKLLNERFTHGWRLLRSPEYAAGVEVMAGIEARQAELESAIPLTMVMSERMMPRETYVLERGEYDKANKDRPVVPSIPAAFGSLDLEDENGQPRRASRLDLANWLTSERNPLVARVAINRLWQMLFGRGLVASSGDFGSQGDWPTHPELLDWLAVEFMECGWDVQHMLTLILTSKTYMQASAVSEAALAQDSINRWISHYPRKRLTAEQIRDQALYVSGLLEEELGGPSVKPYHPEGLWAEVAMPSSNTRLYERGMGTDLWRRSLYTYWKRACPPPALLTLDAPTREICVNQRTVTNTPLQALVLWNDDQFMEAARVLAERTLLELEDRGQGLVQMFKRCTGRAPSEQELGMLEQALDSHLRRFEANPDDAMALSGAGESPRQEQLVSSDVAAWTLIASALLNLHATITQG